MNFKVKCLGSARYSLHWLKRLKGSIFLQRPQKDNSKIRIGIFTKGDGIEENEILKLANKLKQMSNIEIEIRNKPRDIRPMKCSSFGLDEMSTTEMIDWADIIISSRPSSVLFEAVVKEKPIILPEYIYKEINQCLIINYDFIKIAKNEDELLNLIKRCNQKNYDYKNKKEFLNRFSLDFDKESQIPKNFENFYQKVKE